MPLAKVISAAPL